MVVGGTGRDVLMTKISPLLKWAGGKRQLLPVLRRFYPDRFNRYIEPFFGSGAVFFDLFGAGRLSGHDAILIDSNADLIGCYEAVRDQTGEVVRALDDLASAHAANGSSHYYLVRDERFNPLRQRLRAPDGRIAYTPELAAMLIYLNRTGFNGLFRVNASGGFNVPAGRYHRPTICDRGKLRRVADALASPRVRLVWGTFEAARDVAGAGDFVYLDPPYAPLSATSSFTAYTAESFTMRDHERLQQMVIALAAGGCHVLLSNSTAGEIAALYDSRPARAAGLHAVRVPARRSVNSDPASRGPVDEFLISNLAAAAMPAGH
jgi:DNA adenine methylase